MAIEFNKPLVCPVLIGRAQDLATLRLLVDRAKSGQGHVALLSGEAGIGKSRLVAEAKAEALAQGFLLLQGNCFQPDISSPYAPLLDLLRSSAANQLAATTATELAPFARELHQLLPDVVPLPPDQAPLVSSDPEQDKRRLFAALAHFFTGRAAKQPVVLIIEDMHWSDDTSLQFLHYLARRCSAHPLFLLLTYRSDEVRPSLRHFLAQLDRERLAQEISLARLARDEVEAMLRAIFSLPPSRVLCAWNFPIRSTRSPMAIPFLSKRSSPRSLRLASCSMLMSAGSASRSMSCASRAACRTPCNNELTS